MNNGKRFEQNFKNSIPRGIFYYRLRDGSSSWGGNEKVRFQQENICDSIMYDGDYLYTLELKSTKGKSLPYTNIKQHQIEVLLWCSKFANVISGFIVEFSDLDECYFIEINDFKEFYDSNSRKSLPYEFCFKNGIKIGVKKLRINRKFDIDNFIKDVIEKVI